MRHISSTHIVVLLVLIGIILYFNPLVKRGSHEIIQIYHQSQFFKYSGYVEKSLEEIKGEDELGLDQVMGGIVPHHIPTTIPLIAEFYTKLKNTRDVETFVILAPDHIDAGRNNISVSKADFVMPFAMLHPNLNIIKRLEESGFVVQDEAPFDLEHSIGSQLLLISKVFPDAQIVPLIFRSSITNEEAKRFGAVLADAVDKNTFVISSVDFSHYLSEQQARPIDHLSANVLSAIDHQSNELVDADSEQALMAFMTFLRIKGANQHVDVQIFNTKDFSNNGDYTTGYVTGFWGVKN